MLRCAQWDKPPGLSIRAQLGLLWWGGLQPLPIRVFGCTRRSLMPRLLAGSCRCQFLLGFLLLARQTRLAALGELGDFDISWGSSRLGDYRRGDRDFAIFFFFLLFGHENPGSLCPPS